MKALITGITGQDGAYLASLLLQKGYSVTGTTRKQKKYYPGLEFLGIAGRVRILEVDLTDAQAVKDLIAAEKPDEIYNLSAQSSVGQSFSDPQTTLQFNVISVLNLLEAILKVNGKIKFYQASSSEMYGNINALPVREDGYFHPSSPYGISKASAHWLTVNYREGHSLFAVCGILFNHESTLRDFRYVTKKIINSAVRISRGENLKLKLGNMVIYRDWGYAPAYVEAMWLMMQQPSPRDYLICSNTLTGLNDFAVEIFGLLNLNFEEHHETDPSLFRAVDLEKMWGENSLAKKELNWKYDLSFKELASKLIEDEKRHIDWLSKA